MSDRLASSARRRARLRPGSGVAASGPLGFIRLYRTPLCILLYAVTIMITVLVTWILSSRGSVRLPKPPIAKPNPSDCSQAVSRMKSQLLQQVAGSLLDEWRAQGSASEDGQSSLLHAATSASMPDLVGRTFEKGARSTELAPEPSPVAHIPAVTPDPGERSVWGDDQGSTTPLNDDIEQEITALPSPEPAKGVKVTDGSSSAAAIALAATDPHDARALLIICYNRPQYLERTLTAVLERLPSYDRPHIIVSQDGTLPQVASVIQAMQSRFATTAPDIPFSHIQHEQHIQGGDDGNGYMRLARHFGWALNNVFHRGHPRVIILEDDLEIAPDFFEYFSAVAPVVDADPTILAASAYNDIGQAQFVSDATRVYRSDFFPGLGWMMTANAWTELGPKWPKGYWDDWLREPAQAKGRAFLHPEVSRTKTFGKQGVSQSQFFDQYLGNIRLQDTRINWRQIPLGYLHKAAYDSKFTQAVQAAKTVKADEAMAKICSQGSALRGSQGPLSDAITASRSGNALKVAYGAVSRYESVARAFGFIADVKAGVPRTAYQGIVPFRHNQCYVYLVPQ